MRNVPALQRNWVALKRNVDVVNPYFPRCVFQSLQTCKTSTKKLESSAHQEKLTTFVIKETETPRRQENVLPNFQLLYLSLISELLESLLREGIHLYSLDA